LRRGAGFHRLHAGDLIVELAARRAAVAIAVLAAPATVAALAAASAIAVAALTNARRRLNFGAIRPPSALKPNRRRLRPGVSPTYCPAPPIQPG